MDYFDIILFKYFLVILRDFNVGYDCNLCIGTIFRSVNLSGNSSHAYILEINLGRSRYVFSRYICPSLISVESGKRDE